MDLREQNFRDELHVQMCCDVLVTVASGFVSLLVVGGAAGIGQPGWAPWWPQIMETCSNQYNSRAAAME